MCARFLPALLALLLPGAAACAQFAGGVNIDCNVTTGAGAGQPSILFGGAAAQTGYWNPVNGPYGVGASFTLRNLANSADACTLIVQSSNSVGSFSFNNPNATGDTGLLLNDIHDVGPSGTTVLSVGPFAGGVYDVYTYAVAPDAAANRMDISVYTTSIAAASSITTVGGAIPAGGTLTAGVTHAVHRIAVARGERIFINTHATVGDGSLNGLQIKPVTGYTRLYVNSAAPVGGQTGLSWATACTALQRAISIANDTPGVTEIWVAAGTHRPDSVLYAANDRLAIFAPRAGLSIIGSFAGTEAVLADRTNLAVHPTILSADLGVAVVNTDNAYHLMYGPASGALTLDGLILADSHHTSDDVGVPYNTDGSALHVGAGSALIRNCTFRDCTGVDAALVIAAGGSANVTDSVFERNASTRTTALWVSGAGASATVDRCIFRDQTMSGSYLGGCIECDGATLTMANSLIHDNCRRGATTSGMFMLGTSGGTASIYNCTFANNLGGGMYLSSASNVVGRNLILWGNRRTIGPADTIENQQILTTPSTTAVEFSDSIVEGWTDTRWTGLANLGLDPRFIDPFGPDGYQGSADDNFRLSSRSPARDSGWYAGLPASFNIYDITHAFVRVYDDPYFPNTGYASFVNPIDRGCYEAQTVSNACPGDVGSQGGVEGPDGLRDNNDFVVFIAWFFTPDARADVGRQGGLTPGDGLYDNNDFIVFIDMFFTACP